MTSWQRTGLMISIAIVDSGPLVAAANSADPAHRSCLEVLQKPGLRLVIPALCIAEASYLIHRYRGAETEARFLRGLEGSTSKRPSPRIGRGSQSSSRTTLIFRWAGPMLP